ncbi:hypothetical protein ADUPG1_005953, partial [Aduncisulcus paluster]
DSTSLYGYETVSIYSRPLASPYVIVAAIVKLIPMTDSLDQLSIADSEGEGMKDRARSKSDAINALYSMCSICEREYKNRMEAIAKLKEMKHRDEIPCDAAVQFPFTPYSHFSNFDALMALYRIEPLFEWYDDTLKELILSSFVDIIPAFGSTEYDELVQRTNDHHFESVNLFDQGSISTVEMLCLPPVVSRCIHLETLELSLDNSYKVMYFLNELVLGNALVNLKRLSISGCTITHSLVPVFVSIFRKEAFIDIDDLDSRVSRPDSFRSLEELSLERFVHDDLYKQEIEDICCALEGYVPTLKVLCTEDCEFDAKQSLRLLNCGPMVTKLQIDPEFDTKEEVLEFASRIRHCVNLTSIRIGYTSAGIRYGGLIPALECLSKVRSLDLHNFPGFFVDDSGSTHYFGDVIKNMPMLSELEMSNFSFIIEKSVEKLVDGLCDGPKRLTELRLYNVKFPPTQCIDHFARFLSAPRTCESLIELSLELKFDRDFDRDELRASCGSLVEFPQAFAGLSHLKTCRFQGIPALDLPSFKVFVDSISSLEAITDVEVYDCPFIGDEGLMYIAEAYKDKPKDEYFITLRRIGCSGDISPREIKKISNYNVRYYQDKRM